MLPSAFVSSLIVVSVSMSQTTKSNHPEIARQGFTKFSDSERSSTGYNVAGRLHAVDGRLRVNEGQWAQIATTS